MMDVDEGVSLSSMDTLQSATFRSRLHWSMPQKIRAGRKTWDKQSKINTTTTLFVPELSLMSKYYHYYYALSFDHHPIASKHIMHWSHWISLKTNKQT
jgi:hypothetical protein